MHSEVTSRDEDEPGLVARLRRGDPGALEAAMRRFRPRVHHVARRITGNEADAEEVVQDVFLALACKIDRFEGRSALGTWLYRIAVNAAVGKRRDARGPAPMDLEWVPAREPGPAALETRVWVTRALDGLPRHYRTILLLRDVEGRSNDEVASAFAQSVGSIKSRLHRARTALRRRLVDSVA